LRNKPLTGTTSTEVPQYLLEAGFASSGLIACTQPRRVAAISLAHRVAAEQGYILPAPNSSQSTDDYGFGSSNPSSSSTSGKNGYNTNSAKATNDHCPIGYTVRFTSVSTPYTKVKFVTDGMLVRELLRDPLLSRYSVVIVDEAHERTLRTDVLVANLKAIIEVRNRRGGTADATNTSNTSGSGSKDVAVVENHIKGKGKASANDIEGNQSAAATTAPLNPLKVIIMSATLDAEKFSQFFDG
jgi:HrpA-like RNA helicase